MPLQNITEWSKLNVYPLQSGELAARPGLRRILQPDGGRKFVGGFSVQNPYTTETWHYLFDLPSTTSINLIQWSEDVTQSSWAVSANITRTASPYSSPIFNDSYVVDLTVAASSFGISTPVTLTSGTATVSVYLKAGTASITDLNLYDATAVVNRHAVRVTWSAGVPTLSTIVGSGTLLPVVNVGNGWYRIGFTVNGVVATNSNSLFIYPAGIPSATGSVSIWGAQVQNGSTLGDYLSTQGVLPDTALRLKILDEDFNVFQLFRMNANVDPRVITHAVVEGEIIISSPDFDTLWGLVGSGVIFAKAVASDNPSTTAIPVPRGICTPWCNRVVIADGASLFISDPVSATGGSTRTYVGQNQNQRPAPIFGVHEGAGGQLIVLTSRGTYGLDASAAATGIVGSNGTDWRLLNHHESYTHASSCVVRGRIYALSKAGYLLVDIENNEEVSLDDAMMPRAYGPRVASDDYRSSRMVAGDEGPMVGYGNALHVHAVADGVRSWWTCNVGSSFAIRGTLKTPTGLEMLLCEEGVYLPGGNVDGEQLLANAAATQPKAVFSGIITMPPSSNPTVREVTYAAAIGGVGGVYSAVRGDAQSATPPADTRSLVIGTSSWGATGVIYQPTPIASRRLQFDLNGDDVSIEVAADYPETRLHVAADVELSQSAPKRPNDRGN